ncbi:MAG: PAC2 family protein [Acidimicrobiia bacterium]|nr:PAC2 family protein [Acidimicrobiia bacterium]
MTVAWQELGALNRPILVVAFEGWFDVAEAATGALSWLSARHDGRVVASIDPEPYFDFTARRPEVRMVEGKRQIFWPANEVTAVVLPDEPHDLLLLAGVEPHLRWATFSNDLVEIVRRSRAEMVITVGALPEAMPHSRPPRVKGSSTTPELAARLGLEGPTYQGPTGLVGVLHAALDREQVPVISLRVGVPHYVTTTANPKAQRALLEHLQHVTGVETEFAELNDAVVEWELQVNQAVQADPEASAFVARLEAEVDRQLESNLPSGEDLAKEFEQFLQERRDDE